MKKLVSILLALAMILTVSSMSVFAVEIDPKTVYVTISNGDGEIVVAHQAVEVIDADHNGSLTIDEALVAAHDLFYPGGATEGYASSVGMYGLSIDKLWGDTSGAFGYYLNDEMVMTNLEEEVEEGDYINAYIYQDTSTWSDKYCFFDTRITTGTQGSNLELTLKKADFDASYNPIVVPVAGATIVIDNEATTAVTDENGKAVIPLTKSGELVISAKSADELLVPPVCLATIASNETKNVFVSISNKGDLVVAYESIAVTDIDKDGYFTINDVFYAAHEAKYTGGAAAGYESAMSAWGLSVTKLWGDTSGGFGYYVNDSAAWSLADLVKDGDHVYGFVYKDGTTWSDQYAFFDKKTATVDEGQEVTLTLCTSVFTDTAGEVSTPVKDAIITIDGKETSYKTDANGKVTIKFDKAGTFVVSAIIDADAGIITPPVCKVLVKAPVPVEKPVVADTADNNAISAFVALFAISTVGAVSVNFKKENEA